MQKPFVAASFVLAATVLAGCGGQSPASAPANASAASPVTATAGEAAPATATGENAGMAGAGNDGAMVVHVAPGGDNPDRFCMPQWGIANRTGTDVGALLVHLEWRTRDGQVLKPAGEFGTMVEPFAAGRDKDLSMDGHTAACGDLRVVVTTYACRDANAVRMACPGPLRAEASGGIEVDLSGASEGKMKGAVEG